MRVSGVARTLNGEVVELASEAPQDLRRPVVREVIDGVDAIAERRDVPDGAFDEDVLVVDEDDPDELHDQASVVVHSSNGRTTPRHCPVNVPREESPSPGSWTWKETASHTLA